MKKNNFNIIANGQTVCISVPSTRVPGELLNLLLEMFPALQYCSSENLKEKINEIQSLCQEAGIKWGHGFKALYRAIDTNNPTTILESIYETILSVEGMGLMPGIRYAIAEKQVDAGPKIKRRFPHNAEKVSIFKVDN